MGAALAVTPAEHFVVFLPFLRLECEKGYKVGDVEFLPLRDTRGNLPGALSGVKDPLLKILSGYLGRDGEPLNNCVVATVGDHGWDLKEEDFETVRAAAAVFFLLLGRATSISPSVWGSTPTQAISVWWGKTTPVTCRTPSPCHPGVATERKYMRDTSTVNGRSPCRLSAPLTRLSPLTRRSCLPSKQLVLVGQWLSNDSTLQ